jgi:XTP/dITP diphosphohydrolase
MRALSQISKPRPLPRGARLVAATHNAGKVAELRDLLAPYALSVLSAAELGLPEPEETGATFTANAQLKALAAAKAAGLPALADDSGLEVEALGGAPGLHSARYAPQPGATDADRRAYLLQQLAAHAQPWLAAFHSTVCVALPAGEASFASGVCRGEIVPQERGSGGFGYDRLFLVEGLGRTMAELTMAEKNELSHRARAMAAAKPAVRRAFGLPL